MQEHEPIELLDERLAVATAETPARLDPDGVGPVEFDDDLDFEVGPEEEVHPHTPERQAQVTA